MNKKTTKPIEKSDTEKRIERMEKNKHMYNVSVSNKKINLEKKNGKDVVVGGNVNEKTQDEINTIILKHLNLIDSEGNFII